MTNETSESTRRQFVKASAGLAALGAATTTSAAETSWTRERKRLAIDVLVCGGGCAGTAAALAAARQGAATLLIEKAPFAGGIITCVGLPYFDGIADIADKRIVVRGIALELLSESGVCAANATHVNQHNPTI